MKRTTAGPPGIGAAIQKLRRANSLTLDDLAARSGVSKSVLSQIENDRTNPTMATVWRLAEAFGIQIEDLLRGSFRQRGIEIVPAHSAPSLTSADRKCLLRILSPVHTAGRIEWYELASEPGAALVSEPHDPGTVEHLTVTQGLFRVQSGETSVVVQLGETARYAADRPHAIHNEGESPAKAFLVILIAPNAG